LKNISGNEVSVCESVLRIFWRLLLILSSM
jgi:hypothetical protein